jgi:ABC-type Fe3+-hydroxamate transport system substrate-binding protein
LSPPKVVSLVPSITETLLAWGVQPAGVTRFCEVSGFPVVGGTKNPDVGAILDLRPDLVVMDKEENRAEDAEALEARGVKLLVTHVRSLADVPGAMGDLAAAVGRADPTSGEDLIQTGAIPERVGEAGPDWVTVWVPIWRRPWMSIGGATYASSLLSAVGIGNVYGDSGQPYPTMTLEEAASRRPGHVLAPSEPYRFGARHRAELEQVAPVTFVDGRDLFWWGSRTPDALGRLRQLAAALAGR